MVTRDFQVFKLSKYRHIAFLKSVNINVSTKYYRNQKQFPVLLLLFGTRCVILYLPYSKQNSKAQDWMRPIEICITYQYYSPSLYRSQVGMKIQSFTSTQSSKNRASMNSTISQPRDIVLCAVFHGYLVILPRPTYTT